MPWVMMVDSSATIGLLLARASTTSGEKSRRSETLIALSLSSRAATIGRRRRLSAISARDQWRGLAASAAERTSRLEWFSADRIRATLAATSAEDIQVD